MPNTVPPPASHSAIRWTFLALLMLAAAGSRLIQPMPNFTAIGALAVISALLAPRAIYALLLTWGGMFLGDLLLSQFSSTIGWTPTFSSYLGFGAVVGIGSAVRSRAELTAAVALGSSLFFFIFSNGAVWAWSAYKGDVYTADLAGLTECYVLAVPFYRAMVMGDLVYMPLAFAAMAGVLVLEGRLSGRLAQEKS